MGREFPAGPDVIIFAASIPIGYEIPGRARCNCFLVKYIHNAKMGKFNRKQYKYIYWATITAKVNTARYYNKYFL